VPSKNTIKFLTLAALALILAAPSIAKEKWKYLGEANIDGNSDHDKIRVDDDEGRFNAIRFKVEKGAVDFDRVVAHYENGEDDTLPLRETVRPGSFTRALDLEGGRRRLESVEVWYERAGRHRDEKPKVRLMGIRY
jgi:hypothetical protein